MLNDCERSEFDAAGRIDLKHDMPAPTEHEDKITRHYDGDGREGKRVAERCRSCVLEPRPQ